MNAIAEAINTFYAGSPINGEEAMLALSAVLEHVMAEMFELPKEKLETLVLHRSGTQEMVLLSKETKEPH
jgi:hypothetical protein